jgi:hypothetical protein
VTWAVVTILLVIAVGGTLWVPIYARATPFWGDFPFFYWYQLLWVPVTALLTTICYLITTKVVRPARHGGGGEAAAPPLGGQPLSGPGEAS